MQTPAKCGIKRKATCADADDDDQTLRAAQHMAVVLLSPHKQGKGYTSPLTLIGRLSQSSPQSPDQDITMSEPICQETQHHLFRTCLEELTGCQEPAGVHCGRHCCAAHLVSLARTKLPNRLMGMTMWLCLMLLTSSSCDLRLADFNVIITIGMGTDGSSSSQRESVKHALQPEWICNNIKDVMSGTEFMWYSKETTELVLKLDDTLHRVPRKYLHTFMKETEAEEVMVDVSAVQRLQRFTNDKSYKFLNKNRQAKLYKAQALLGYCATDNILYDVLISKERSGVGYYNFQSQGNMVSWPHKVSSASHMPGVAHLYNPAGLQSFTSAMQSASTLEDLHVPEETTEQVVRDACCNTIDRAALHQAHSKIVQNDWLENLIEEATTIKMVQDPHRLFTIMRDSIEEIQGPLDEAKHMFDQSHIA